MKEDRNLLKGLAQSAYVMSTIGGGMSMPNARLIKKEDHYLYKLSIPGVDHEHMSVEINNQHLFIFQLMGYDSETEIPYMVKRLLIPAEVEFEQIRAEYDSGQLNVIMPFNELAGGYHRHVDIERH